MPQDVIRVGEPRPAGFWIRAVALAIDFVVFFLVQGSYGYLARRLWGVRPEDVWRLRPTLGLFMLIFTATYTSVLHATHGQTIGKNLVRIRVIGADGRPVTFGAALLRWMGYFVSLVPLPFGFLMAALRRDKRALHDLIAGTRVERVPAGA